MVLKGTHSFGDSEIPRQSQIRAILSFDLLRKDFSGPIWRGPEELRRSDISSDIVSKPLIKIVPFFSAYSR